MRASDTLDAAISLADIHQLVKNDFEQVNSLIRSSLSTNVPLIEAVSDHIIQSGGKRLRPLLSLLAAQMVGCQSDKHIILAVIVEFLHTATLLHDDVVDASTLRRGQQTANTIWGNAASVLVGDFLYSRAFQLMTGLHSLAIYALLADATNVIAQGEVLQLTNRNNPNATEARYLEIIRSKTATLFSVAAECGIAVANGTAVEQQALAEYGLHLGMAFQMLDDWLDYAVPANEMGKNPGDDLAEGKITLPLIYAMQHGSVEQVSVIQHALQAGSNQHVKAVLAILKAVGAEAYVAKMAQAEVDLAKSALSSMPENRYKQALLTLADLAIQRRS